MSPLNKGILAGAAVMLLTVAGALLFFKNEMVIIQLTAEEIEQAIGKRLPYEKELPLSVRLVVSHPRVSLTETGTAVRFGVDVAVEASGFFTRRAELKGAFDLSAGVSYQPKDYTFYLHNPRVVDVRVTGASGRTAKKVRKAVNKALERHFRHLAIYRLKDKNLKQKAARLLLRRVEVLDGKLHLTLGI